MPIDKSDFDSIAEQDLQELIEIGVPEGHKCEYKSALYGYADADKKEALKDISSFANSSGGHLILGIEEHKGIPKALTGLSGIDPDAEILRLEQLVRSGIEPRITGIRIKAISLVNGSQAIVVRIPKSWNYPHRISAQNANRFYLRNSGGVHEANIDELRRLFMMSSNIRENIRAFRNTRLDTIISGQGPLRLNGGGRLILHIVPLTAFESTEQIDLKYSFSQRDMFRPIGSSGYSSRFNFDGLLIYKGEDPKDGYTQIFRNGILEATKASLIREREGHRMIPGRAFDKQVFEVLPKYINGLQALGIAAPLVVMLTLEGIEGAYLVVSDRPFDLDGIYAIDRPVLYLPEITIEEYGSITTYQSAMRPAFDALWNAIGFVASRYFDEQNVWIGDKNFK